MASEAISQVCQYIFTSRNRLSTRSNLHFVHRYVKVNIIELNNTKLMKLLISQFKLKHRENSARIYLMLLLPLLG